MKEIRRKSVKVVKGTTPEDFEAKLNRELKSAGSDPELQLFDGLLAYIVYTVTDEIPETPKERAQARGERHSCSECPYMFNDGDKRRKWMKCTLFNNITRETSDCCDWYYDQKEAGNEAL